MTGMLFIGFTSFSQSINSLNPEKKKDAAYVQQQQQLINQGMKMWRTPATGCRCSR